jgi:benzoate-CoA ligase family protein
VSAAVTIPARYNASSILDQNLETGRGDKAAILAGDETVTYSELLARACGVGAALRERGIDRGDRVLLVMDDCPWLPAAFLGAMRIGAVPVPVNPLYGPDDYPYFVEDSGARLAIVDRVCSEKVRAPSTLLVDDLEPSEEFAPVDTTRDDVAFWLYSSGSTGRPKGVVHLHRDLLYTCETYGRHVLAITAGDVTFSTTKLFHAYGLGNNLSFPFWAGATTVLLSGRPTPEAIFSAVGRFRPTLFFSVPTLYNAMLAAEGEEGDFSSVRVCISAAEPLPADVWHRWRDRHGLVILDGIGSTEMLHIYCSNTEDDVTPGSSGRPVPGYDVKLVGDDGNVIDRPGTGDLYVRGQSMLREYWNQPEKTADCIRNGWFYTRDRYRRGPDGRYWYEGRADDMFKVSGLWVSPADVEARLIEHRAVLEAAVVGVHVEGFTKAKAFVTARDPGKASPELADDLREHCAAKLHRYEVPQLIEFVDSLPKTATGKIERYKLRETETRA